MNWFKKISLNKRKKILKKTLEKTKNLFFLKIKQVFIGKKKIDEEVIDKLEEILISCDVGINTTLKIINQIEERIKKNKYISIKEFYHVLREEIGFLIKESKKEIKKSKPWVIVVVGVNGVGKTTTIGKLANRFKKLGKKVTIGAADTFRAAAIEQLDNWAKKSNAEIIKKNKKTDPASVVFDSLQSSIAKKSDILIIDTAGRLHNKVNLMNELSKIERVIKKVISDAPHEVLLVLDASTGQNAFEQTKSFKDSIEVNGIVITKLDGTSKGGMVIGISNEFKIPIKYICVGEKIEDILPFNKNDFIDSFFEDSFLEK